VPGIFVCSQSDNHPKEDIAKSGYKPYLKYKSLIILNPIKTKYRNLATFNILFLTLGDSKSPKSLHFEI
jgi:hypothetical protein